MIANRGLPVTVKPSRNHTTRNAHPSGWARRAFRGRGRCAEVPPVVGHDE